MLDLLNYKLYILVWSIATLIGLYFIFQKRESIIFFKKEYIHFLFKGWKLVLLAISHIGLCGISLLGYDPSWDIPITLIMGIMTYYFGPYSAGIIYKYYTGQYRDNKELYIASILLLFITCWVYELYALVVLLGVYPPMALGNMMLSPFFYLFAGMMWSLDYSKSDGVIFVYTKPEWIRYKGEPGNFSKIFIFCLPIILFMCGVFGLFIYLSYYGV